MITRIVAACARRPYVVLAAAALTAAAGYASQRGLARDAIPDLSDPQLVLVAEWMGHSAPEVASQVTQVITGALQGLPGAKAVRGSSMADIFMPLLILESLERDPRYPLRLAENRSVPYLP